MGDTGDPPPEAPPAFAWLLGQSLWGPGSNLFQLVAHLLLHALQGSRVAHVAGPVGAGKSTTLVAFSGLQFLATASRTASLCQANHPLDGTAETAYQAIHPAGTFSASALPHTGASFSSRKDGAPSSTSPSRTSLARSCQPSGSCCSPRSHPSRNYPRSAPS